MDNKAKYLIPLCLVLFIDSIGAGLVLPILPELFLNPEYGLVSGYGASVSNFLYGFSFAVVPLASLLSLSFFGALSDIVGRRPMIILGLMGILLSYIVSIVSILVGSVYIFILSRFIVGISIGTYSVVYAAVADISDPMEDRMLTYRWTTLAFVTGFIIGPLLGGTSSLLNGQYSLILPFIIGAALTLMNVLVALKFLPESFTSKEKILKFSNLFINLKNSIIDSIGLIFNINLTCLSLSYGFLQFSFGLYFQSISLYFAEHLHYSSGKLSLFYVMLGFGVALNALVLQKTLSKFFNVLSIVYICLFVMTAMIGLQLLSAIFFTDTAINIQINIIWLSAFFLVVAFNLSNTAYMALFSNKVSDKEQGKVMGLTGQIYSITWFIGGLLVGFLVLTHAVLLTVICFICFLVSLYLLHKGNS